MSMKWFFSLTIMPLVVVAHVAGAKTAPKTKPHYIYAENGTYYYAAAISRQQREAGYVAGDAVGYKFYGKNANGEYVLARVSGSGSIEEFIYCKSPCRVIRTGSGDRIVNNSRLLVNLAFSDAFRGALRNTNPDRPKPRSQTAVAVPSRSPFGPGGTPAEITRTANGVIIRGEANSPVYAAADGVVGFAGQLQGYGKVVRIEHGAEIQTVYGNLGGIAVAGSTAVKKGQIIGYLGAPIAGKVPQLIYEVRIEGVAVDPIPYLGIGDAEMRALFESWQNLDKQR